MVVMTAKVSKKKLLLVAAAIALAVVLVICLRTPDAPAEEEDARAAFLSSFGYSVKAEPVQVQQVRIPDAPSEVFDRYNELQKSQGYDLSTLAGRSVTRYVYEITDSDGCYATVLEYRGEIVGGDVSSAAPGGRMHGFAQSA